VGSYQTRRAARGMEVCARSPISKVIWNSLRGRLDLPLEYDGSRFSDYYYTEPGVHFQTLANSRRAELSRLIDGESASSIEKQYRARIEKPLVSADQRKWSVRKLPDTVSFNIAGVGFQTNASATSAERFEFGNLMRSRKRRRRANKSDSIMRKAGQQTARGACGGPAFIISRTFNGELVSVRVRPRSQRYRTFVPPPSRPEPTAKKLCAPRRRFRLEKRVHKQVRSGARGRGVQHSAALRMNSARCYI